jgi:hypothetical protein
MSLFEMAALPGKLASSRGAKVIHAALSAGP